MHFKTLIFYLCDAAVLTFRASSTYCTIVSPNTHPLYLQFASEIIHLWGEFASATGWAIVLGVRVLSILAGTTKQWFFMAWSDKVRYPKNR